MKNSFTKKLGFIPLAFFLILISCQKDSDLEETDGLDFQNAEDYDRTVVSEWMQLFLDLERFTPGYRPPVSARAAAYLGIAGYEAALPGMSDHFNSLAGQLPGLEVPTIQSNLPYHWPTAVHAAYATIATQLFPTAPATQQQRLFTLKQKFINQFRNEVDIEVFNRSDAFGNAIANAVFRWSATDDLGHEAFLRNTDSNYNPPQFEGSWQPTYPDFAPALLPYWGQARTFVANDDDKVPPPIPYSSDPNSSFYVQAKECMILCTQAKAGNNPEDRWIADFWSDDCPILTFTPAGRWIAVALQVIDNHEADLALSVYTLAKVGMALNDAGVRCWSEKYRYNLLRPIDYVHQFMGLPEWNTIMCPDGSGNYYTPPFPAYPSGHATFGAAAAEVLTDIFGSHYSMTDRSHEGRTEFLSTPRTFGNFYEMAAENSYSRLPLGVHFRMDADSGLKLGYAIGRKINRLSWER